ncbi:MAG: hypothetical protein LBU69_03635 [Deltaproteobacteria bacterium]|nr:hypothetical protein [Deltaproteobacteria bacterium]
MALPRVPRLSRDLRAKAPMASRAPSLLDRQIALAWHGQHPSDGPVTVARYPRQS